jgi:hypothetical protein
MSATRRLAAILAADVRRSASGETRLNGDTDREWRLATHCCRSVQNSRNMQQGNIKIEFRTIQSHRKGVLKTSFPFVSTEVPYRDPFRTFGRPPHASGLH